MDRSRIQKEIEGVAREYGVALFVLFGSQASGQTHTESDVDVAYFSDQKIAFEDEARINARLTEIFRTIEVQLVNLKTASPLLLRKATENAVILYEARPHLFDELYLYALRTYEEAKPLFSLREEYVAHKLKRYEHAR